MQLLTLTCRAASGRTCQLTGKKANNGYVVTFSHKRNKKLQHINLQEKKVYWPEGSRWVKLRVCTKVSRLQAISAPLVLAATYHIQEQELLACQLVGLFNRNCICLQALKTIEKKGLNAMAREAGLDLSKLPYTDVSKNRLEYLAKREPAPPMPRKIALRRMKNPEKLAASKKKPLVAKYLLGNRVYLTRDD